MEMHGAISKPLGLTGVKLLYAIDRNRKLLERVVSSFDKDTVIPASEEFKRFNEEHSQIFKKLSANPDGTHKIKLVPTANGQPIETYDVDPNSPEYLAEKARLNKTFEEALKERDRQVKSYNDFLNEEYEGDLEFFKVPVSLLPADISDRQFQAISWMIADFPDEVEKEFMSVFEKVLA